MAAAQLHYLTVQDILWINLQVTGKVHHFNYAKLEEATYYQYAYGDSKNLVSQAARFLPGFLKMSPIEAGNEATAFIAALTFLKINGMRIEFQDANACDWFMKIRDREVDAAEAIKSVAKPIVGHHESVNIRMTVKELLGEFPCTVLKLQGS